ncbi:unnamed protein product [Paramecium sonneborni]|uniref:Protein kinase domain-containing protein n=1 Tax=Paramecium sonneborni TaxID=65129 RepID=A0A8S1RJP2_9CILI|nr:unnamed protein product [Paramecium sonneborni]
MDPSKTQTLKLSQSTKERVETAKQYRISKRNNKSYFMNKKRKMGKINSKTIQSQLYTPQNNKLSNKTYFIKRLKYQDYRDKNQAQKDFEPIGIIGRGAFGEVRLCKNKLSNDIVAVKKMKNSEMAYKKQVSCQARICNNQPLDLNTDEMQNYSVKIIQEIKQHSKNLLELMVFVKVTKEGLVDKGDVKMVILILLNFVKLINTIVYLMENSVFRNELKCQEYKGSDGYCKGVDSTLDLPCQPKVCEDAPKYFKTDEECNQIQISCFSTGN